MFKLGVTRSVADHQYVASRELIGTLLATTSKSIRGPEWQRSYAWEKTQFEAFWTDLIDFSDKYPGENIKTAEYFLGSVVLVTGVDHDLLLDGQQRLEVGEGKRRVERRPVATVVKDPGGALVSQPALEVLDLDDVQSVGARDQEINLADVALLRDEGKVRPRLVRVPVGQALLHVVERRALPREARGGDLVPDQC